MIRIAPSFIPAADFARLGEEVARIEPYSDMLHIDVMDGHFVPNITVGAPVVKSLRKDTKLFFDCHLMISNPAQYLEDFKNAGADSCTVHIEAGNTDECVKLMRDLGMQVGLGIKPNTEFDQFAEYLDRIDMLLIMTVEPGFGGQKFMNDMMPKLKQVRTALDDRNLDVKLEVDGGIDISTAPVAAAHGADTFVAGSAIFGADDPAQAAQAIREAIMAIEGAH